MAILSIQSQENEIGRTVEYDTISGGYLEVVMNTKIDALLEEKENKCDALAKANRYHAPTKGSTTSSSSSSSGTSTSSGSGSTTNNATKITDLCAQYPKLRGYRIQVLTTKESAQADKAKAVLSSQFSYLSSNIEYRRPQFKLLVGDYFTRAAAARDLSAIKKKYPSALLVVGKIWCRRAK